VRELGVREHSRELGPADVDHATFTCIKFR
jgi:hypothetical protein